MKYEVLDSQVCPDGDMEILSKGEIKRLLNTCQGGLHTLFRNCSLAVLNYSDYLDDGRELLKRYKNFDIRIIQENRGIKLELKSAPASAFVDGKMITGIREHLFSVLRDVIYINNEIIGSSKFDLDSSEGMSNAVFHILRNSGVLHSSGDPRLVVCWGGHAIRRNEYDYSKEVGYQLGLRGMDICTGCGIGAMKGPMKGAAVGHAKQRIPRGQYLGISEPGIIASESPNPIVNNLVILPDIEKRLEAFVRLGHAIVIFPGGVGTVEEILYLLGILIDPRNTDIPFPLVFTGPKKAESYFEQIDRFIGETLGNAARQRYKIIIDDPEQVACEIRDGIGQIRAFRKSREDAFYFNWLLSIDEAYQRPFKPSHENMRALLLHKHQESHVLAANLRKVFSGVVAGNVKADGIRAIEKHGPFEIHGDSELMEQIDLLLSALVEQKRMRLSAKKYIPCYRIIK